MKSENLFQIFSQVFIESQQSFNKCDVELRTKCRTLASKLNAFVDELENRRDHIKESVSSLQNSTKGKIARRRL